MAVLIHYPANRKPRLVLFGGVKTALGPAADGVAVGQQVVKPALHGAAREPWGPEASGQRQRQRPELTGAEPTVVVAELLSPLDRQPPGANPFAVHPHR